MTKRDSRYRIPVCAFHQMSMSVVAQKLALDSERIHVVREVLFQVNYEHVPAQESGGGKSARVQ